MPVTAEAIYGTRLVGSVEDLNAEPEHVRVGLLWSLQGPYLDLLTDPPATANLAAHRIIADEVARHIAFGSVRVTVVTPHSTTSYSIGPDTVTLV